MKGRVVEVLPSTAAVYESTPKKTKFEIDEEKEDDVVEEVSVFGSENFIELVSTYLKPYFFIRRFLDKCNGIRREDDGVFVIGDSTLLGDDMSDISIKGRHFKGTGDYVSY